MKDKNLYLQDRSNLMLELELFLEYLLKAGYCDTDVYTEEPTAIDGYMKEKE